MQNKSNCGCKGKRGMDAINHADAPLGGKVAGVLARRAGQTPRELSKPANTLCQVSVQGIGRVLG